MGRGLGFGALVVGRHPPVLSLRRGANSRVHCAPPSVFLSPDDALAVARSEGADVDAGTATVSVFSLPHEALACCGAARTSIVNGSPLCVFSSSLGCALLL